MTAPRELHTTRLLLRSLEIEDATAMVRLAGANEIAATTLNIPHPTRTAMPGGSSPKQARTFTRGARSLLPFRFRPGRDLCGAVGLNIAEAHRRAELGYWIGVPFWGKGFATEAAGAVVAFGFETQRLHRILAHYFCGNTASHRVLEKIGMRHEGRFRQHIQKWGRIIDVENYGLLAEEFRAGETARRSDAFREGE